MRKAAFGLCMALVVLGGFTAAAWADKTVPSDKIVRQIGVMEKIIDKVLLDSPNFLVSLGDNARGLYLPEYGAVFTFNASLTGTRFGLSKDIESMIPKFETHTDADGNTTFTIKKSEKKHKSDDTADKGDTEEKSGKSNDEDKYEKGKAELVQAMLDYGETMTGLRDGQWVLIAAFFNNVDFLKQNKTTKLILKAKIDDLRAAGSGAISESEAKSRIQIEEY